MRPFSDKPYRFFPPRYRPWAAGLLRFANRVYILPWGQRVRRLEVTGGEAAQEAAAQGDRLLFLPNHPTHSDGQILTEALRRLDLRWAFMAAYDVFLEGRLKAWGMQSMGGFSIDRDCCDRRALRQADEILREGPFALTIFPEGQVYLQNDHVTPFMEGAVFTAVSVARKVPEGGPRVLAVPVSIKATYAVDVRPQALARMRTLAAYWNVPFEADKTPRALLRDVGQEALSRELDAQGLPHERDRPIPEQISIASGAVLEKLCDEVDVERKPGDPPIDAIRQIRRIAHEILLDPEREAEHAKARDLSGRALLAWRISSYSGAYVAEQPSVDRIAETLTKLEEDAHDLLAAPLGDRHAYVHLGTPIDVGAAVREGGRARALLRDLTDRAETAVQSGIDEINARNTAPGADLWT